MYVFLQLKYQLTKNLNGDERRLSLSNLVDSNAGDVGLSLQGQRADVPVERINILDLVAIDSPDDMAGSRTAYWD